MSYYFTNDETLKSKVKKINVIINNLPFSFYTDNGVFSKKGLDFGTRTLLENLPNLKGDILDIGCGYGPIGIYISKKNNLMVDMVDVNRRSLDLSIKNSKLSIREILEKFDFNIDSYLEESVEYNLYQTEELTFGDTLGDNWETIKNTYTSLIPYNVADDIMTISDYNKVAKFYGNEEYTINEDEYIIVADYDSMIEIRNVALKDNQEITVFGHTLKPKYNECQYGFVEMASNHINSGIIIVPDDIVDDNYIVYNCTVFIRKISYKNRAVYCIYNLQ